MRKIGLFLFRPLFPARKTPFIPVAPAIPLPRVLTDGLQLVSVKILPEARSPKYSWANTNEKCEKSANSCCAGLFTTENPHLNRCSLTYPSLGYLRTVSNWFR